jgi:hypothetical protein
VFVDFNGQENEKEFLEKCLEQWDMTTGSNVPEIVKITHIGTIFHEMRHRLNDLKEDEKTC